MQRQSKFAHVESRSRRGTRGAPTVPPLAEVARRFAQFRSQRRRGARVPDELRAAALAVLERGVTPAELERCCGVAWSQLVAWRDRRRAAPVSHGAKKVPEVRAFAVVEEDATLRPPPVGPPAEDELELRLGPWSLTLRLSGPRRARE
jgi:hypothetical protein